MIKLRTGIGEEFGVEQHKDNVLHYTVSSRSDSRKTYEVFLDTWTCTCPNFKYRISKNLVEGAYFHSCMCKHIDIAFDFFAMNMRDALCKMEEERSGVKFARNIEL